MPILKQLVSGSNHKRRSRMDLTREMISAPLGDFRHTMHVGRSGDAFGDTSFLSTRSGEPPREEAAAAAAAAYPHSPRPGLLSRTFRSSKRSLSVTRVDQQAPLLPGDSPTYVKNAMSLPFLNDDDCLVDDMVPKSLSSSPLKQEEPGVRPSNGAAGAAQRLEMHERGFGELTELPEAAYHYGGGMKHAESVMSFHIDLGPSMLGDILGVMQQKEEDDQGYDEEWKGSEGSASPSLSARGDAAEEEEEEEEKEQEDGAEVGREEEEEEQDVMEEEVERQEVELPGSVDMEPETGGADTPETRPRHLQQHLDSCSVSSAGSAALEERAGSQPYADTDSATFSAPPPEEESNNLSSFMMEDEDDEIPL